jgi:hypothetical protein
MRSLWTKIGLGAAGVFLAGMLLLTVAREAKSAVRSALASAFANTVEGAARASALREIPFRLDGTELGMVHRLAIARKAPGEIPDVNFEVQLSDLSSLKRLAHCDLVLAGGNDFSFDQGFRCGGRTDRGLIALGQAMFTPGDLTRPVKVTKDMVADLRDGDPFEATAEMGGDVRVLARGQDGGLLRVKADSHGAQIHINDAMGRALLRLLADSTGASLRVRGKDGKDVLRMEAGQGGFSLTVDTSAAQ